MFEIYLLLGMSRLHVSNLICMEPAEKRSNHIGWSCTI